jgi:hypothetical protein
MHLVAVRCRWDTTTSRSPRSSGTQYLPPAHQRPRRSATINIDTWRAARRTSDDARAAVARVRLHVDRLDRILHLDVLESDVANAVHVRVGRNRTCTRQRENERDKTHETMGDADTKTVAIPTPCPLPIVMPTPNDVLQLRMVMFSLHITPQVLLRYHMQRPQLPTHLTCTASALRCPTSASPRRCHRSCAHASTTSQLVRRHE